MDHAKEMRTKRDKLDDYAFQNYPSMEKLRAINDKKKRSKTTAEERSSQHEGADSRMDPQDSEEKDASATPSKAQEGGEKSWNKSATVPSANRLDSAISRPKSRASTMEAGGSHCYSHEAAAQE